MKATLMCVLTSSALILALVAVRAAQPPGEQPNPLLEAQKKHKAYRADHGEEARDTPTS